MMESERLSEVLYRAWVDSDPHLSLRSPSPWLELSREDREHWRYVAEAAQAFCRHTEDWHGKTP